MRWVYKLILIPFLLFYSIVEAQTRGKVTGTIVNATNKSGIEYATVSLVLPTGKVIDGTITDTKGNFTLKNIAAGSYQLKVEFVGYKSLLTNFSSKGAGTDNLGRLALEPTAASLQEVTVTASKPLVENHLDKIVFNAANDITSQSGVALDVLKKVPMVSVDVDGNVELEGNANIRFLINGKPSTIFGASLADALQSIPASQIKSIEVIASPGAKYDASGTGGIINIILKDNKVKGINGSVNLSGGSRLENGSFNLNVRRSNFGIGAFFSGNEQLNTTTLNTINRQSHNSTGDTLTTLSQDGSSAFKRQGYQTGLNLDWDISPKDKLVAGFNFNHFNNLSNGTTAQIQETTVLPGGLMSSQPSTRTSGSKNQSNTADWSLDYKKSFHQKGRELEFLATTSTGNNFSDYYQQQSYPGSGLPGSGLPNSGSIGSSPGTDHETDLSLDYRQPVSKTLSFETGVKSVLERLSTTTVTDTLMGDGSYAPDANQTYAFVYKRQIYAYYLSAEFSLFHEFLEGQAGLRYEYTHTSADYKGASIPSYGLFFPSLVLSHKLDESQSIKIAYSSRIERPGYGDLNPFYNISDPHNISTGNPGLLPEKGYRYELGYMRKFDRGASLYLAAFYRHNTDDLQNFATYYAQLEVNGVNYTDVTLTQRENIGTQSAVGMNIFGSVTAAKALNLRTNIMIGSVTNQSPGIGSSTGFLFRSNLNASYNFGKNLIAEIFGNFNASMKTIQGTRPSFEFYTLAVRKEFLQRKASLGLTATNPFNKYVDQHSTLYGSNFSQTSLRRVPYQSFGLTLSYKFGKLEFKARERENSNEPAPIE